MGIKTEQYIRKPLYVDAVNVTVENFDEVTAWCQGEVQTEGEPGSESGKKFIKVRVMNPMYPKQTQAFVGDWILYTDRGYKVYTDKTFIASFDKVPTETADDSDNNEEVETPPVTEIPPTSTEESDEQQAA